MRFWVNTTRAESADDSTDARLNRASADDRIVFYAPRPQQCFTAIGTVGEGDPRSVSLLSRGAVRVQPLIDSLDFIRNKKSWGVFFRRGFFEIGESDFKRIESAMRDEEAGDST